MTKLEKALYYPVLMLGTLVALEAWWFQPWQVALPLTLVLIGLWFPVKNPKLLFAQRIILWIVTVELLGAILWVLYQSWAS